MSRSEVWLASPAAAGRFDPARQSPADAARWPTLRFAGRRREWAASRALIAELGERGLRHSSLTHSQGWSAALVAPAGLRAGVDLEWLRPRDVLALARHAYAPEEVEALAALPEAGRALRFTLLWTLKECSVKALGLNLFQGTRQCRFAEADGRWQGTLPVDAPWRATAWQPRPGAVLAVLEVAAAGATLPAAPAAGYEWPEPAASPWPVLATLASPG